MKWRGKDINEPNVFLEEDFYTNVDKNMKIDDSLYEDSNIKAYDKFDKKLKNRFYLVLVLIAVFVFVIFAYIFVRNDRRIDEYENQAKKYYAQGNYKEAAEIYGKLFEETGNIEYNLEHSNVSRHIESQEILNEASNEVRLGEYEKAIEILLTVNPLDDSTANRVFNIKARASDLWIEAIENSIKNGNKWEARSEVLKFLNLQPNNAKAIEIKNTIDEK